MVKLLGWNMCIYFTKVLFIFSTALVFRIMIYHFYNIFEYYINIINLSFLTSMWIFIFGIESLSLYNYLEINLNDVNIFELINYKKEKILNNESDIFSNDKNSDILKSENINNGNGSYNNINSDSLNTHYFNEDRLKRDYATNERGVYRKDDSRKNKIKRKLLWYMWEQFSDKYDSYEDF